MESAKPPDLEALLADYRRRVAALRIQVPGLDDGAPARPPQAEPEITRLTAEPIRAPRPKKVPSRFDPVLTAAALLFAAALLWYTLH